MHHYDSWRIKDQLDVTCYFISLLTCLFCWIITLVLLFLMCVGVSVWLGWSGIRVTGFNLQHKMCILVSSTRFFWNISHVRVRINKRDVIKIYIGLHVKYLLVLFDFKKLERYLQTFKKAWNIKFHENPSCGNRVVPCGQRGGQTWRSKSSLFAILRTRLKYLNVI